MFKHVPGSTLNSPDVVNDFQDVRRSARSTMLAVSKLAKLLVRLFDRQVHAAEKFPPPWIGMKAGELGI
jgi:hypothetical protein